MKPEDAALQDAMLRLNGRAWGIAIGLLFGVGLPDENAHAPNEKLDLGNFHGGVVSAALLYAEIAKIRSRPSSSARNSA